MPMMRRHVLMALCFGVLFEGRPAAAQHDARFLVVVNAGNPATSITREQLSQIFLKRVDTWPNGAQAEPVDLAPSAAPRVAFTTMVHHKAVGAVRAFWQQQIFSGRDVPPPEKDSEREVVAFIKEHVGAVGYVSADAELGPGVKAIDVQGAR
jgi:ABC-type phosphate transport system substrate-binding protein